jgi:hypothetical protein
MICACSSHKVNEKILKLISNFRRVLNVICFLLGDSSLNANVLEQSVCSTFIGGWVCSTLHYTALHYTLAFKLQMLGNHPEESIQQKILHDYMLPVLLNTWSASVEGPAIGRWPMNTHNYCGWYIILWQITCFNHCNFTVYFCNTIFSR